MKITANESVYMRTIVRETAQIKYGHNPERYELLDQVLSLAHLFQIEPAPDYNLPDHDGFRVQKKNHAIGREFDVWYEYAETPDGGKHHLSSYRVCFGREVTASNGSTFVLVENPRNEAAVIDVKGLTINGNFMEAHRISFEWRRDDIECRNNGPARVTARGLTYTRGQPPEMTILFQKWHDSRGIQIQDQVIDKYIKTRSSPLELTPIYYPFSERYFHSAQDEMIWIEEWNSIGTGLT